MTLRGRLETCPTPLPLVVFGRMPLPSCAGAKLRAARPPLSTQTFATAFGLPPPSSVGGLSCSRLRSATGRESILVFASNSESRDPPCPPLLRGGGTDEKNWWLCRGGSGRIGRRGGGVCGEGAWFGSARRPPGGRG